jgi:tRNA modification GTPase
MPGTTRDWLVAPLSLPGGVEVDLIDTAGMGTTEDPLAEAVRDINRALMSHVDLLVVCQPADALVCFPFDALPVAAPTISIVTRSDTVSVVGEDVLACSSVTGAGLVDLVEALSEHVASISARRGAPHLVRGRAQLEALVARLRVAHAVALEEEGAELVALELRHALDALGEIVGSVTSDDLLGRVFSRFCIGK